MGILVIILSLASFVACLMILIAAFQESAGQGFLSLCVPFYILYYAFARYQSPNKMLVILVWLVGSAVAGAIQGATIGSMLHGIPR